MTLVILSLMEDKANPTIPTTLLTFYNSGIIGTMISQIERARTAVGDFLEYAQTSRRALIAEGIGTVIGFSGAFAIERPAPAIVLGIIGFASGAAGLSNLEYQDAVHWQTPPVDVPKAQE